MTTKTNKKVPSNPPVARIRVGSITASIWENQTENGKRHSVTFEQRYKDKKGNWQSSHSFNASAALFLAKAADLAHDKMQDLRAANTSQADDDGPYIDDEAPL